MKRKVHTGRAGATGRCDGFIVRAIGPRSRRGFTLIEVIVAFAVLALALTLVLGTLSNASRQVRWSDDAGRAALHAQSLLDDTGVAQALVPGRSEGTFEDGRYRWTLEIEPWREPAREGADTAPSPQPVDPAAPRLLKLALDVRWGDAGACGDAGDARTRLHLESLRWVRPEPLAAATP
jgi:general secretion pathway protein I